MYQLKTVRNKALLMRRLVNLKLKSRCSVAKHISEFQSLINQLASIELSLDDEILALFVLSSLLDSRETLVVSPNNFEFDGKLSMSIVKVTLFNKKAGRNKQMWIRHML